MLKLLSIINILLVDMEVERDVSLGYEKNQTGGFPTSHSDMSIPGIM